MDVHEIAGELARSGPTARVRWGTVTAVGATTVDVTIAGSTVAIPGVRRLASYSPTINDTVVLLVGAGDLFVLGKLA